MLCWSVQVLDPVSDAFIDQTMTFQWVGNITMYRTLLKEGPFLIEDVTTQPKQSFSPINDSKFN